MVLKIYVCHPAITSVDFTIFEDIGDVLGLAFVGDDFFLF